MKPLKDAYAEWISNPLLYRKGWDDGGTTTPFNWWKRGWAESANGLRFQDVIALKPLASQILQLRCSTAGIERNCKTVKKIHSRGRNRLKGITLKKAAMMSSFFRAQVLAEKRAIAKAAAAAEAIVVEDEEEEGAEDSEDGEAAAAASDEDSEESDSDSSLGSVEGSS